MLREMLEQGIGVEAVRIRLMRLAISDETPDELVLHLRDCAEAWIRNEGKNQVDGVAALAGLSRGIWSAEALRSAVLTPGTVVLVVDEEGHCTWAEKDGKRIPLPSWDLENLAQVLQLPVDYAYSLAHRSGAGHAEFCHAAATLRATRLVDRRTLVVYY